MQFGLRKWMIVPTLLAAVGCAGAQAQQSDTQPETQVRLRADGGQVQIEIVDTTGEVSRIVADAISLLSAQGEPVGSLLLNAAGTVTVNTQPEPTPRVRIGLTTETIPQPLAAHLSIEPNLGLMVTGVTEGLAAQKAGLARYDLVVRLDDQSPVTQDSLRERVERCQPGETIKLTVVRQGEEQELNVVAEPYGQYEYSLYGVYDFQQPATFEYKIPDYTILTDTYTSFLADPVVVDMTTAVTQPEQLDLTYDLVVDATRRYLEYRPIVVDSLIEFQPELQVATDDCPIAALRAELKAMKEQIAAMEALVDRIQTPRDE